MDITCRGRVKITCKTPQGAQISPPVGGGIRVTYINCPLHGSRSFIECYDTSTGRWELQTDARAPAEPDQ